MAKWIGLLMKNNREKKEKQDKMCMNFDEKIRLMYKLHKIK